MNNVTYFSLGKDWPPVIMLVSWSDNDNAVVLQRSNIQEV